jgi:predicted component of type VI protein secretion system
MHIGNLQLQSANGILPDGGISPCVIKVVKYIPFVLSIINNTSQLIVYKEYEYINVL